MKVSSKTYSRKNVNVGKVFPETKQNLPLEFCNSSNSKRLSNYINLG